MKGGVVILICVLANVVVAAADDIDGIDRSLCCVCCMENKGNCPCNCSLTKCQACCSCCDNESYCTACYGYVNCASANCDPYSSGFEGRRSRRLS